MTHRASRPFLLAIVPLLLLLLGSISCDRPTPTSISTAPSNPAQPARSQPPPLIAATLSGDSATVRSLLEQEIDPNLTYHTNTALTYAARDGYIEIAQLLIDWGAEVNWIDSEGVTPLILASFKNHPDLAQLLLKHGADTTVVDQWGRTALDYALRRGAMDPIAQLLKTDSSSQ